MKPIRAVLLRLLEPMARRLDVRIVVVFLGLLCLVQLASFITIRRSIDANANAQVAVELRTGEGVLRRLLAQNAQNLTEGARLLAADYGFRSAIASGDAPTILDALDNQSVRIGANVAVYSDARQQIVARTDEDRDDFLRKRGFSRPESAKIIEKVLMEEGRPPESIFDFVQGITRLARDKTQQDARLDMEGRAKKLLDRVG